MTLAANGGGADPDAGGAALHVLIGLKRLDAAKQRLAPDFSLEERRELMLRMLASVVTQAHAAALGPVTLATSEPTARGIVANLGIDAVSDGDLPWNQGLVHALDHLRPGPGAVLYLAGDLPLVRSADLRAFVASAPPRGVAIARARDGGTNALLVRPASVMQPMFGRVSSAAVHAARAAELGLEHRMLDLPGLALDVDTIVDAGDAGVYFGSRSHNIHHPRDSVGDLLSEWRVGRRCRPVSGQPPTAEPTSDIPVPNTSGL